jgi:hypothetical protein
VNAESANSGFFALARVRPQMLVRVQPAVELMLQALPSAFDFGRCSRERVRSLERRGPDGTPLEMFGYAGRSRAVFPQRHASLRPPFTSRVLVHGLDSKSGAAGCESLAVCFASLRGLVSSAGPPCGYRAVGWCPTFRHGNFHRGVAQPG